MAHLAPLNSLYQLGPRDVEQVSGLLGGQLGMGWNQGDGIALGHLRQYVQEQPQGGRRHGDGFGILAAVENLKADAGAPAEPCAWRGVGWIRARAGRRPRSALPSQSSRESIRSWGSTS
jgi:hypothetical protein